MSIPSGILSAIETGVDAMTALDYNFGYGPVDVFAPVDMVYPQVFLEFPEDIGEAPEGGMAGHYDVDRPLAFRVLVPTPASGSLDAHIDLVENDIKALMDALHNTLSAQGMIYATYRGSVRKYRLVRDNPAEVTITFLLRYRQQKSNPGG